MVTLGATGPSAAVVARCAAAFQAAAYFGIPRMASFVECTCRAAVQVSNVCIVAHLAHRNGANDLLQYCQHFMAANFVVVSGQASFGRLPAAVQAGVREQHKALCAPLQVFDFEDLTTPPRFSMYPRTWHAGCMVGPGHFVTVGGGNRRQYVNTRQVHIFDTHSSTWSSVVAHGVVPSNLIQHRMAPLYDAHARAAVCFGGSVGRRICNAVRGGCARRRSCKACCARGILTVCRTLPSQVYLLDVECMCWRQLHAAGDAPVPRVCHSFVNIDGTGQHTHTRP